MSSETGAEEPQWLERTYMTANELLLVANSSTKVMKIASDLMVACARSTEMTRDQIKSLANIAEHLKDASDELKNFYQHSSS